MANTIAYASAYMNMIDRIYKENSSTAILEMSGTQYKWSEQDPKTIYIRSISTNGMGTYSRSTGYVAGDATIGWASHTITQDRTRSFTIDVMDLKEALTAAAEVMAEFIRDNVTPELDAYRFTALCTLCSIDAQATLTYDTVLAAIDTGIAVLDNAEVPRVNRVMFISNEVDGLIKQSGEFFNMRYVQSNNGVINRTVTKFDDMDLIRVPSGRFWSACTFKDGTTGGQTAGGFATGGYALNFIILDRAVVAAVIKHVSPKMIAPEYNMTSDGWFMAYRILHDLLIPANKLSGVYIHSKN